MAPSSSAAASRVLAILLDTSLTPLDCLTLASSELVSAASPELSLDVEINQTTPLIAAASAGHGPDLVTFLLSQNYCSANFVTSTGNTALRAATKLLPQQTKHPTRAHETLPQFHMPHLLPKSHGLPTFLS